MNPPKPIYSYLAAAALALVTIFTFYVFQNFGPQSAIRRFLMDVASGHVADLDQVSLYSTEPHNSPEEEEGRYATMQLAQEVASCVRRNASYEIVSLKSLHGGHEVAATVEFRFPNGYSIYPVWHVVQTQSDWRIDSVATMGRSNVSGGEPPADN